MAVKHYRAAGGVVMHPSGKVLVLWRPARGEVRLPKGHIDAGETAQAAALREVGEESGFVALRVLAPLGVQEVHFTYQEQDYVREERYFLMLREGSLTPDQPPEAQFQPRWLPWDEALRQLSYESEREWVRRALIVSTDEGERRPNAPCPDAP